MEIWRVFFLFFLRLFLEEEKKASSRGSVKSVVRIFIPSFNYIFFFFFISIVSSLIALLCYDSYIDSSHSFLFSFAFVFFFFWTSFDLSLISLTLELVFFFFFKKKRFQRENGRGCVRGKNCTDLVVLFSTRQSILFSFFFFKAVNKTHLTSLSGLQWLPVLLFCYTIKIPEQDLIFLYLLDAWVY